MTAPTLSEPMYRDACLAAETAWLYCGDTYRAVRDILADDHGVTDRAIVCEAFDRATEWLCNLLDAGRDSAEVSA